MQVFMPAVQYAGQQSPDFAQGGSQVGVIVLIISRDKLDCTLISRECACLTAAMLKANLQSVQYCCCAAPRHDTTINFGKSTSAGRPYAFP